MHNSSTIGQVRYFLVTTDCMALKMMSESKSHYRMDKSLPQGTLLEEVITDRQERSAALHKHRQVVVRILDEKNPGYYAVELNRVTGVTEEEAQLLLSVTPPRTRASKWNDKDFMNEMKSIREGSKVIVCNDESMYTPGIVLKKRTDRGSGVKFEVQLLTNEDSSEQESEGGCVVVPLGMIRLAKDQSNEFKSKTSLNLGSKVQQRFSGSQKNQTGSAKSTLDEFVLNERVVWVHDGQYHYGVVCFMGCLPDSQEQCVGVKFDTPIRCNNGEIVERKAFSKSKTKKELYTSINELKKEKDVNFPPASGSSKISPFKSKKKKDLPTVTAETSTFYGDKMPMEKNQTAVINTDPKLSHSYKEASTPEIMTPQNLRSSQTTFKEKVRETEVSTHSPSPKSQKSSYPISKEQVKASSHDVASQIKSQVPGYDQQPAIPSQFSHLALKRTSSGSTDQSPSTCQRKQPSPSPPIRKSSINTPEYAEVGRKNSNNSERIQQTEVRIPKHNQEVDPAVRNMIQSCIPGEAARNQNRVSDEVVRNRSPDMEPKTRIQKDQGNDTTWHMGGANVKTTEEKLADLKKDEMKQPLTKFTESVSQKSRDAIMSYNLHDGSMLHYSGRSPDSPDVHDFYHVVPDDCQPTESHDSIDPQESLTELERHLSLTSSDFNHTQFAKDIAFDLDVGSVVQVPIKGDPWYGVIRWIGHIDGTPKTLAGIEMEEEHEFFKDGTLNNFEYFQCHPHKGLFVYLHLCKKDARFLDSIMVSRDGRKLQAFGSIDCPPVPGDVPPMSYGEYVIKNLFDKNKGIQGHHNSCYLDATLFSMFAFTSVFDNLLNRPPTSADISCYQEVQNVLKEEIVNPLRHSLYVRADRVMKLRTLLEKLSSVSGLTCEEKDPEEFLNSLLHQILKADPYLKLSSGQEAYFYQLFVEKNDQLRVPTVQQLFDQSFLASDLKLKEVPSCLIIQMPRHGKQFKMYNRIFPSPVLDITDVLENSPRQCIVCGEIAEFECRDCFYLGPEEFTIKALCEPCLKQSHIRRSDHQPRKIKVPSEVLLPNRITRVIPRVQMDLFAVVCIETSHYVAFVKCGDEADVPWSFFDSMADRRGEQNGYNIPEVSMCTELSEWLTEKGFVELERNPERSLPDSVKRLFGDAYMCMYQSSAAMMYH